MDQPPPPPGARPEPTRTRRPPGERRDEIIRTAVSLADNVGLDRITARDIAAAMNVAPGLVHHYFATMDELVVATLKQHAGENRRVLAWQLEDYPPLAALATYVVRVLDISRTSARIWLSAWMTEARRPDLAHELASQDERDVEVLHGLLRRGVTAGVFQVADTQTAAIRILTVVDGLVVRVSRRDDDRRAEIDQLLWGVVEREAGLPSGSFEPYRTDAARAAAVPPPTAT